MSQWAEIRHQHFVEGVPKKELARRFGLNVKTVRRALAREEVPVRREAAPRPCRLDPWRAAIQTWLEQDPKITAKRIRTLLKPKAGAVPERTVRKYVARMRRELFPKPAFVHRTHPPGVTMEADFGESWAAVGGDLRKVKFLVATLPASNVYFAKAYPVERLECLLDGLAEAFVFFGGVTKRVVLDNTSLAVKKVCRGRDRVETEAFHAFRGQYPFGVDYCAPAKGNEKGSAETGVKYVRNNVFRPMPEVADFDELNARIVEELLSDVDERRLEDGRTVRQAWQAEREHLRPLPAHRPETCRQMNGSADKFGHVKVGEVNYSVPIRYAHRAVWVKAYFDRVEIAVGAEVVARHERVFKKGTYRLDPRHVLPLLARKHRAVFESTAVSSWKAPAVFERLLRELRKDTRKPEQEWVKVLLLAEEYPAEAVEAAAREALDRESGRLETIRQILRQQERSQAVRPCQAPPADVEIGALEIEAPELSSYDAVGERS